MRNPLSKTPFLFLLIPLVAGILFQYFIGVKYISIAIAILGIIAVLLSYIIPIKDVFRWRWLFGVGAACLTIALGIASTFYKQSKQVFDYDDDSQYYRAVVLDAPKTKNKTIEYKVRLLDSEQNVLCYLKKDTDKSGVLSPGDIFFFYGKIEPFQNRSTPENFDYVRYMYNQGFVGRTFVGKGNWERAEDHIFSLKTFALNLRDMVLSFYRSLGFEEDEYAVLAALSLGYQDEISSDLLQGFRTTGTVHVLSVSGLHVGIIYMLISFLLGFIRKGTKQYWIKPVLIILLLWVYAFLTGLSIPVVRASLMLTFFCIAELTGRKNSSLNTLFIAAFFVLLVNPFSLFDIGFQLSFLSVFFILYLHPIVKSWIKIKNKFLDAVWQLFTLSVVAQLATFPLCLYYFGTFPTYFFATNLLIVPLVSLITYGVALVFVAKSLALLFPFLSGYIIGIPILILQYMIKFLNGMILFFDDLPFAQISDIKISLLDLFLILVVVTFLTLLLKTKRLRMLTLSCVALFLLLSLTLYQRISYNPNKLSVYDGWGTTDIRWNIGQKDYRYIQSDSILMPNLLELNNKRVLVLTENIWGNRFSNAKFEIDLLVISGHAKLSICDLSNLFSIKKVIFDSSLSFQKVQSLSKECKKLNIPYHDVVQDGVYSFIF